MKILADATLPHLFLLFKDPFTLTLYNSQSELPDLLPNHDILLCRSTLTVSEKLLANSQIQCVATASSGIDHVDQMYLCNRKIQLFDAKGCNAAAVADYVVATLASLDQNGLSIGKRAGVIGVGEVGTRVAVRLKAAGFNVICFDPLKTMLAAQYERCSLSELSTCDVLCVHANLHHVDPYPSANLLSMGFLQSLKPGTTIINAARGGVVNEEALLKVTVPLTYCTDVYLNEPAINADVVDFATRCTPHIAGHSIESKHAAIISLSKQLHQHFGYPFQPASIPVTEKPPILAQTSHWQEAVLQLYDPLIDTIALKKARDLSSAFLKQRSAHQYRHDFSFYDGSQLDQHIKELMGCR